MNQKIKSYVPIAKMVADTFGNYCEIIIHDFSNPQNSVVYIQNNNVTKRQIGESFTEYFIKDVLLSRKFHDDCSANYMMKGDDGKIIKSSTALIRDESNKVIGALCINIDITHMQGFISQIEDMIRIEDGALDVDNEIEVVPHVKDIVDDIIDKTIGNNDVESMNREQKIDLIRFMDSKGIFLIKGSTDKVAEKMNISKVTVYSYLDDIKKNDKNL